MNGKTSPTGPIWGDRAAEEQKIFEAVFRYQFDHNASGQQQAANVYCISIGERDTDPSDQFMQRFAENKPPVRKVSECNASRMGVVDRRSGRPALIFRITGIVWMSSMVVRVSGGYFEGGLSASGNTYTVEQRKSEWKVTKDEMGWIAQRRQLRKWLLLRYTDFVAKRESKLANAELLPQLVRCRPVRQPVRIAVHRQFDNLPNQL